MDNIEIIMSLLKEINGKLGIVDTRLNSLDEKSEKHTASIETMSSDIKSIIEQQQVHTTSIIKLENSVTHELKLLGENLPNAIVRSEKLKEVSSTVEEHDHRIFALEQKVAN